MGRRKIDPALHKSPKVFGRAAIEAQFAASGVQRIPGSNRSTIPHDPPDLDAMSEAELQEFVAKYSVAWGTKKMFPTRPNRYKDTAKLLMSMASIRIQYLRTNRYRYAEEFGRMYERLPNYAKWRRYFNPLACVAPGKKFRKNPRKVDRNGKIH